VVFLIYPHQLYPFTTRLSEGDEVWLIEDPLFFSQYRFHRQKLILHRASMKEYVAGLARTGQAVRYVEAAELNRSEAIGELLLRAGHHAARVIDPNDDWLTRRLTTGCERAGVALEVIPDPHYLTESDVAERWLQPRRKYFFTEFYVQQRKSLGILLEPDGNPVGGKWTFDTENRKRLPARKVVPAVPRPSIRESVREAERYVDLRFPSAFGTPAPFEYPVTHEDATSWLDAFLAERFYEFGVYEDAISRTETTLFHSVLTPALNIGLLTPRQVVDAALAYLDEVPLNSLEGFIRQVIGWREFMRLIYRGQGRRQRTANALNHHRPMPPAFYDGTTGIPPVDVVIRRVLQTGYCHHIERLMILGNFMVLLEIHPDAVYQWFMELFIDAYDWVMVPNVYGMSQYADGGLTTTKPYISGSNYLLKMSDYPKGDWCEVWDALYWRFVDKHRDLFLKNPRLSLAVATLDRMGDRFPHLMAVAEKFLVEIHGPE
jgi:deoxyribodipyrimidine photolyase-related protein